MFLCGFGVFYNVEREHYEFMSLKTALFACFFLHGGAWYFLTYDIVFQPTPQIEVGVVVTAVLAALIVMIFGIHLFRGYHHCNGRDLIRLLSLVKRCRDSCDRFAIQKILTKSTCWLTTSTIILVSCAAGRRGLLMWMQVTMFNADLPSNIFGAFFELIVCVHIILHMGHCMLLRITVRLLQHMIKRCETQQGLAICLGLLSEYNRVLIKHNKGAGMIIFPLALWSLMWPVEGLFLIWANDNELLIYVTLCSLVTVFVYMPLIAVPSALVSRQIHGVVRAMSNHCLQVGEVRHELLNSPLTPMASGPRTKFTHNNIHNALLFVKGSSFVCHVGGLNLSLDFLGKLLSVFVSAGLFVVRYLGILDL